MDGWMNDPMILKAVFLGIIVNSATRRSQVSVIFVMVTSPDNYRGPLMYSSFQIKMRHWNFFTFIVAFRTTKLPSEQMGYSSTSVGLTLGRLCWKDESFCHANIQHLTHNKIYLLLSLRCTFKSKGKTLFECALTLLWLEKSPPPFSYCLCMCM